MIVEVKRPVQRPALKCLRWVKTGKAQYEHMFSAVHPRTDIDGFSRACDGQQNVRTYYATLPRPTVWRTSKPSNWAGSRYSALLSPARLCAARNASDLVHASNTARFSQTVWEA